MAHKGSPLATGFALAVIAGAVFGISEGIIFQEHRDHVQHDVFVSALVAGVVGYAERKNSL